MLPIKLIYHFSRRNMTNTRVIFFGYPNYLGVIYHLSTPFMSYILALYELSTQFADPTCDLSTVTWFLRYAKYLGRPGLVCSVPVWFVSFRYARKIGENAKIQKGYCHNDGRIRAKFRDQTLHISLPLRHISEQQKQEVIPVTVKTRFNSETISGVKAQGVRRRLDKMMKMQKELV